MDVQDGNNVAVTLEGYIDHSTRVFKSPVESEASIVKTNGLNGFFISAQGITMLLLQDQGFMPKSDGVNIPYITENRDSRLAKLQMVATTVMTSLIATSSTFGTLVLSELVAITKSSRPIVYGLVQNQQYRLSIYAEKFTYKIDGEMHIELELPKSINIKEGEPNWRGTDKLKVLELVVVPTQAGSFTVSVTARNLESDFFVVTEAIIHVESTSDEVKQWIKQNN